MEKHSAPKPALRRTRFVCIADTHNFNVKLPRGDVLIHAGDLTNQGTHSELSKAVRWLEKAEFETKIVIAGNHDITLDVKFYSDHGLYFHNQAPQDPSACLSLLTGSSTITYLCHTAASIRLSSPNGPHTAFTVFGSPFSPRYGHDGHGSHNVSHPATTWAFQYDAPTPQRSGPTATLPTLWDAIPLSTDVVVTHTPARGHCDETRDRRSAGCEALRRALWRVRPRLAVCGHVHESRGSERVRWMLGATNVAYEEEGVQAWADPSPGTGSKMSLVNLTGRKGGTALENDGGDPVADDDRSQWLPRRPPSEKPTVGGNAGAATPPEGPAYPPGGVADVDLATPRSGTQGLGGSPESARSDQAALAGRLGRRETCVINCAVVASNHPHIGGRRFNKPIVIDLDLPVWNEDHIPY